MMVYHLNDIQTFIKNTNEKIPYQSYLSNTVLDIINKLDSEIVDLNPVSYTSTTNKPIHYEDNRHYLNRGNNTNVYHKKKNNQHTSIESWIAVRNFKPTKMEVKEGIEKNINEIRSALNKISSKNFETQKEAIFSLIDKNLSCFKDNQLEYSENEMMSKISQFIFDTSSSNKFYSELYADLYKELIEKYSFFMKVLEEFTTTYKDENIKLLPYVDSNKNYDGYCEYIKSNEKRRSTILFFILLMKRDILPREYILDLCIKYISIILEQIDQEEFTNENDEYTEFVSIILMNGKESFVDESKFLEISNQIEQLASYKIKEKKGLSSRSIFKYKDLLKIIKG